MFEEERDNLINLYTEQRNDESCSQFMEKVLDAAIIMLTTQRKDPKIIEDWVVYSEKTWRRLK